MKKLALLVAGLALSTQAIALPQIVGIMDFEGDINVVGDLNTNATISFSDIQNEIGDRTGDFATTLQGDLNGNFFSPITIAAGSPVTPIVDLWSVTDALIDGPDTASFTMTGTTYYAPIDFDLDGNFDFLNLQGTGILSLTGFADTAGTFTLSSQSQLMSFSADTAAVPIPAAAWMFGTAMLGLGGIARKRNGR